MEKSEYLIAVRQLAGAYEPRTLELLQELEPVEQPLKSIPQQVQALHIAIVSLYNLNRLVLVLLSPAQGPAFMHEMMLLVARAKIIVGLEWEAPTVVDIELDPNLSFREKVVIGAEMVNILFRVTTLSN